MNGDPSSLPWDIKLWRSPCSGSLWLSFRPQVLPDLLTASALPQLVLLGSSPRSCANTVSMQYLTTACSAADDCLPLQPAPQRPSLS